jgi:hypothetical protein
VEGQETTETQAPIDKDDQFLVLPYYPDRSLNPFVCTDFTNRTLFSLVYQGLFSVDKNYETEPILCSSYTMSEDMKVYTFYLESATFSDLYHPEFLKPGGIYNSVIYLLVDLQLVLISALVALSTFGNGLKGLFTGKPNRNSVSAFMVLFALAHPAVLLLTGVQEYPLFGSLAALFLFFGSVANRKGSVPAGKKKPP